MCYLPNCLLTEPRSPGIVFAVHQLGRPDAAVTINVVIVCQRTHSDFAMTFNHDGKSELSGIGPIVGGG